MTITRFSLYLTILFVALKLTEYIDWDWWVICCVPAVGFLIEGVIFTAIFGKRIK